jgi:hypothetical protein
MTAWERAYLMIFGARLGLSDWCLSRCRVVGVVVQVNQRAWAREAMAQRAVQRVGWGALLAIDPQRADGTC